MPSSERADALPIMQVLMLGSLFLSRKFRVLALEQLKLGEPLVHSVCDLRPTDVALHLNDWYVCFENVEVCQLAFTGGDRLIEVIANVNTFKSVNWFFIDLRVQKSLSVHC